MKKTGENKVGEEYAFFHYEGKKEEIQKELPWIRETCKSPRKMKLSLSRLNNLNTNEDSALSEMVYDAKSAGMNYVLKATLPNESNERTASYSGDIGNGLYYSLYDENKDKFYFDIIYKEGEKYAFKMN